MWSKELFLMPCLFAVFEICHRSHSPLCSLFQIPKPTKIQVKIAQLILSPLLKIGILKISGSALAAEICTGPHNRLLRRQHCSSLCSQSEGHEHVANMVNALGYNLVIFQLMLGRRNIRPPHFASKVSYSASPQTFAECSCTAAPERGSYLGGRVKTPNINS